MKPFTTHTGIVATLDRANVDTDAIIPKQFLKSIKHTGYGPQAFFDWIRPLVRTFLEAIPNPAHLALAQLEQIGKLQAIITQKTGPAHVGAPDSSA